MALLDSLEAADASVAAAIGSQEPCTAAKVSAGQTHEGSYLSPEPRRAFDSLLMFCNNVAFNAGTIHRRVSVPQQRVLRRVFPGFMQSSTLMRCPSGTRKHVGMHHHGYTDQKDSAYTHRACRLEILVQPVHTLDLCPCCSVATAPHHAGCHCATSPPHHAGWARRQRPCRTAWQRGGFPSRS